MTRTISPTRAVVLLCAVAIASAVALAALVAVMSKPAGAATDRLPDLRMARLSSIQIQTRSNGDRWLRFDTVIVNVGAGPFEARGARPVPPPPP